MYQTDFDLDDDKRVVQAYDTATLGITNVFNF